MRPSAEHGTQDDAGYTSVSKKRYVFVVACRCEGHMQENDGHGGVRHYSGTGLVQALVRLRSKRTAGQSTGPVVVGAVGHPHTGNVPVGGDLSPSRR